MVFTVVLYRSFADHVRLSVSEGGSRVLPLSLVNSFFSWFSGRIRPGSVMQAWGEEDGQNGRVVAGKKGGGIICRSIFFEARLDFGQYNNYRKIRTVHLYSVRLCSHAARELSSSLQEMIPLRRLHKDSSYFVELETARRIIKRDGHVAHCSHAHDIMRISLQQHAL